MKTVSFPYSFFSFRTKFYNIKYTIWHKLCNLKVPLTFPSLEYNDKSNVTPVQMLDVFQMFVTSKILSFNYWPDLLKSILWTVGSISLSFTTFQLRIIQPLLPQLHWNAYDILAILSGFFSSSTLKYHFYPCSFLLDSLPSLCFHITICSQIIQLIQYSSPLSYVLAFCTLFIP